VAVDEAFDGADADAVFGGERFLSDAGVEGGDQLRAFSDREAFPERRWGAGGQAVEGCSPRESAADGPVSGPRAGNGPAKRCNRPSSWGFRFE